MEKKQEKRFSIELKDSWNNKTKEWKSSWLYRYRSTRFCMKKSIVYWNLRWIWRIFLSSFTLERQWKFRLSSKTFFRRCPLMRSQMISCKFLMRFNADLRHLTLHHFSFLMQQNVIKIVKQLKNIFPCQFATSPRPALRLSSTSFHKWEIHFMVWTSGINLHTIDLDQQKSVAIETRF